MISATIRGCVERRWSQQRSQRADRKGCQRGVRSGRMKGSRRGKMSPSLRERSACRVRSAVQSGMRRCVNRAPVAYDVHTVRVSYACSARTVRVPSSRARACADDEEKGAAPRRLRRPALVVEQVEDAVRRALDERDALGVVQPRRRAALAEHLRAPRGKENG
eukprot:6202322-Pleurochrysis_carterae.AAC.1